MTNPTCPVGAQRRAPAWTTAWNWITNTLLGAAALTLILALPAPILAQDASGTIAGRVLNSVTGDAMGNARVQIKGTNRSTQTDAGGFYTLTNVPAGEVTVEASFTGFAAQEATVTVGSGLAATQDFVLGSRAAARDGAVVELDQYVVRSTRETNAAIIAVNEQRNAGNITSVVSTDEFGTTVDKNPGEFLKWLPGVDVETFANNIVGVSVRGLGSVNTEINFDGMPVASMNAEAVNRSLEIQYASAADISRVEIRKLPLPQDSSNAIGGAINLVRRTAFEYSRRQIAYQFLLAGDGESLSRKIDGPKDKLRERFRPNWEIKWTEPVSKTFGFALTLGQNDTIANTHWSLPGWSLGSAANNTFAAAEIAAGRPVPTDRASIYNPAMRNPLNHNAPLMQGKNYATARVDWRPNANLTLGYTLSYTQGWKEVADDIRYRWDTAATGSGEVARFNDATRSDGRLGGGAIFHDNPLWRDIDAPTVSHVAEATWKKGAWEIAGRGVWSVSQYDYEDTSKGFFNSTSVSNVGGLPNIPHAGVGAGTANPISLTVNYGAADYWGPQTIEAFTTATGASSTSAAAYNVPVAWWDNDVIRIGGARSRPGESKEIVTAFKLYAKRDFDLAFPLNVQLGLDWSERFRNRRYDSLAWRFVGADGVANSADDTAAVIAADNLPRRPDANYGYPGAERISMSKLYNLYLTNPNYFQFDAERSAVLTATQNAAYDLTETITAPYVQFDTQFLEGRLRLTGGVRYEKHEADARGLLIDNSAAYMKYSDGTPVRLNDRDASGNLRVTNLGTSTSVNYVLNGSASTLPATRAGAPIFLPHIQAAGNALRAAGKTTDTNTNLGRATLAHSAAIYRAKGATGETELDNYFPSLHAIYSLSPNFLLRVGYAKTQARNRFDRSVIPNNDINDNPQTSGALGRISLRNENLRPWIGDNWEARLEYYNSTGGSVGLGGFYKRITDYQVSDVTDPLSAQEIAAWGYGPEYAGYEISTMFNEGTAYIDGVEFEVRQNLDQFLPDAFHGFSVFGTVAFTNMSGQPAGGDFANIRDKRYTFNIGYRSRKLSANVGYIMNGQQINNGNITSNGLSGEQVTVPQHMFEFKVEYSVNRWASVFFQGANLSDELRAREDRYEGRPIAQSMGSSNTFGIIYTAGITGRF